MASIVWEALFDLQFLVRLEDVSWVPAFFDAPRNGSLGLRLESPVQNVFSGSGPVEWFKDEFNPWSDTEHS